RVFDRHWVAAHLPDAELQRQRAAYRRGLLRAAAVGGTVALIMIGLTATAISQADQARRARDRATRLNRALQEALRTQRETNQRLIVALDDVSTQRNRASLAAVRAQSAEGRERTQKQAALAAQGQAEQERRAAVEQRARAETQKQLALAQQ